MTLTGEGVRLVPMTADHAAELYAAGRDPAIWTYLPRPVFADTDDVLGWIGEALAAQELGDQVPFVVVDTASERVVGSTRFLEIRTEHRGLEIGWTWLASSHQRTGVNTAAKQVLLRHAFLDLSALRVQFKTDARNEASQRAIERIGGVREGVLRKHYLLWDGHVRDSVYFSITAEEWPAVDARLARLLSRA